jgi:hypothetical protein
MVKDGGVGSHPTSGLSFFCCCPGLPSGQGRPKQEVFWDCEGESRKVWRLPALVAFQAKAPTSILAR